MDNNNQIKKGIILSYLTLFLSNGIGLIITPLLLQNLGTSEFGLYSLIGAFVGYIAIMDFGINNTIIRYVAKYRAEKDQVGEENFLALSLLIYSILAILVVAIGIVFYYNIDQVFSDSLTPTELNKAKIMFAILVANLAFTLPLGAFGAILTGYGEFVLPKSVSVIKLVLRTILLLSLLFFGYKAIGIVILDTILNIVALTTVAFLAVKKFKVRIKLHYFDKHLIKEIFGFSFWVFLVMVVDQIYWRVGQGVLGIVADTVAVAIFVIGIQLAMYLMSISSAISNVFFPKITHMVTENATGEDLTNLMIKVGRFQFMVIGFIFSGFLLYGQDFIQLWLGDEFKKSWLITIILMGSLILPLCNNTGMYILMAKKKHAFRAILYLSVALFNLGLSIYLAQLYGPIGVAVGTAISLTVNTIIINLYYHQSIGLNILKFFAEFSNKILISLLIAIGAAKFLATLISFNENWISLISQISFFAIIYALVLWFFGFNRYEKHLVTSSIEEIINKLNARITSSQSVN